MADRIGIIVDLVGAKEAQTSIKSLLDAVNQLNGKHVNLNIGGSASQIDQTARSAQNLASALNSVGDAFSALGSVSGAVADFTTSIGNSFTRMNQIFKTDIGSTVLKTLTYNATNAVTGNLNKTISRYDILNTFTQYMNLAGVGTATANNALSRVNESILGLPIGLDEAAQRLRRYQMFMGDTNAATDLTIGVQNAIMAGGATSAAKTQTYNLIERLIATGGLTNIRQWQALLVGLGVSQRYIAEELGADPKNLLQDLSSKAISTDQFLAALQRLGSGATDAAVQLNSALGIYKNTLEAWLSNIQFAFTRGNANILDALNESLTKGTGQGITGYMRNTRDTINSLYRGGVSFINENPGLISGLVNDAKDLIGVLRNFSASEFASQAMNNLGYLMELIGNALGKIPQGRLEEFAAFATTLAGPLGKLFSAVSSGAPALLGVFDRFQGYDWNAQINEIIDAGTKMADLVSNVLGLIDDSAMQKLIAYGLVWGKPVQGFFNALGGGLRDLGSAYIFLKGTGFLGSGAAGGAAAAGGAGAIALGISGVLAALGVAGVTGVVNTGKMYSDLGITDAKSAARSANIATLYGSDQDKFTALRNISEKRNNLISQRDTLTAEYYDLLNNTDWQNDTGALAKLEDTATKLGAVQTEFDKVDRAYGGLLNSTRRGGGVFEEATEQAEDLANSVNDLGEAYTSVADIAEESVKVQIGLFDELKVAAAKSFSELFETWESNTDIYNRWAEAMQILMQYGLEHPESAAMIQQLAEIGPEAGLGEAELWVGDINSGKGIPQTTENFNAMGAAAKYAAEQTALLMTVLNPDTVFDFNDALSLASQALGIDGIAITEQLRSFFGDNETITRDELGEFIQMVASGLEKARQETEKGYNKVGSAAKKGGARAANEAQKANAAIARAMESLNVNPDQATAAIAEWGWAVQQGIISAKILAVAAANDAVSAINAALGNVRATPGSASVDRRTGRTSGFTQTPYANGGIIYAANGMLLDFGAIGTDTVPAMLTPGEFVVRRAAVNRVGIPFLQRLNSLDMAGAFDRAIKTGVFSGGGMVRNYYRDNHAQVTMNNYRASQDYSSRRMGRYVRSL